jgi:hypothetical protein
MRTFAHKVYDTNGATPQQNIINHMNARTIAQNNLAKSGGGSVTVPQFRTAGPPQANNPNDTIQRAAGAQLKMDSLAKAQANTGQPIQGGQRKTKTKQKQTKRKTKRKSRKYYLTRLLYGK